ncbi:MAG: transcription elongation factor NusA [Candidatus Helarchaeota archaeon]
MRTMPICKICAKTGVLCNSCEIKLENGEITQLDIDLANYLIELEGRFSGLKEANFYKTIDMGSVLIILVGKGDISSFIGPRGKIIKLLQEKFGKNIRVVEKVSDLKKTLEDLIVPAKLLGMNKIYLPTGEVESKARLRLGDQNRLPASPEVLEEIIYRLTKERIRIAFE